MVKSAIGEISELLSSLSGKTLAMLQDRSYFNIEMPLITATEQHREVCFFNLFHICITCAASRKQLLRADHQIPRRPRPKTERL